MRTLLTLAAAATAAVGSANRFASFPPDTISLRPPAVPLIASDQFFSQWSAQDHLYDDYTVHWTIVFGAQGYKAMSALAKIDGTTYRLMGPECPPGLTPALPQLGYARVYPTSTLYRFQGAGVSLNLTFTQPLDPAQLATYVPLSYVTFDVASVDGAPHAVSLYLDATGQLAVNTDDEEVTWARTNVTAYSMRIGTAAQAAFDSYGDDNRISWGWLHLAALPGGQGSSGEGTTALPVSVSSTMASSNLARYYFIANSTLPPDETAMPIPTCQNPNPTIKSVCACQVPGVAGAANDWPALALAWDMGVVPGDGTTTASAFAVLAYDDVQSVRFFGQPQQAAWRAARTADPDPMSSLLTQYLQGYDSIITASLARDRDMVQAWRADTGYGEPYERLASLAFRQTWAANKLTYYDGSFNSSTTPAGYHYWVKGCASSGDTGTLDDNLPAFPLFLLYQPLLVEAFLTPLLMWAGNETYAGPDAPFPRNMTYNSSYAPHYLGQHPVPELQCWYPPGFVQFCEPMPLEMSADMILLVAATAGQTGDYSFADRYWPLLDQYAQYLVGNGLYPGNQRSTDDYEGFLTNSSHLAAKAIVALGAWSQLLNATGRAGGAYYASLATSYRDTWLALSIDPSNPAHTMLTYDSPGSYSLKYSILFDQGLGLGLIPGELVERECRWLQTQALPYGWILQQWAPSKNTWTNLGWEGWMAAVCPPDVTADLLGRLVAFVNETDRRVPLTDWYDAATAKYQGFTARAQVGGLFAVPWLQQVQRARVAAVAPVAEAVASASAPAAITDSIVVPAEVEE